MVWFLKTRALDSMGAVLRMIPKCLPRLRRTLECFEAWRVNGWNGLLEDLECTLGSKIRVPFEGSHNKDEQKKGQYSGRPIVGNYPLGQRPEVMLQASAGASGESNELFG